MDWTSIRLPRTPRDWGDNLLYMGAGLGIVALLTFLGFSARGASFPGAVLGSVLFLLGALFGVLGLFLHRFPVPADEVQDAMQLARAPRSVFGESNVRHDGRPLSKAEDDIFRSIVNPLENEDPRTGSGPKA